MATYYARNVTGNWALNTSWDSAASTGAGPAGPPVAGDTAIFDANFTGSITVAAAASCLVITGLTTAAGTLTISSGQTLLIGTGGTLTFVSGQTLEGTGTLQAGGSLTWTTAITADCPWSIYAATNNAFTLAQDLVITGTATFSASTSSIAGTYNFTCGTLIITGGTFTFPAGKTLAVNTAIGIARNTFISQTVKSSSAGTDMLLTYNGTLANCKIAGATFTDVDASGSGVFLYNWHGVSATVSAKKLITVTGNSFPAASAVLDTTTIDGNTAGTIATRTLSADNETVAVGYYAATTLSAVDVDLAAANIATGKTIFGFAGSASGGGGGQIMIDGAWKTISSIFMMIAGAWKQITS